ncbi:MAG: amidase [Bacteroidetes bacterium HGW-Bacteroidetes-10]|nr:MAG: amidase [Bacteroidetes bacterium HGW-Bacteroidetes-10]
MKNLSFAIKSASAVFVIMAAISCSTEVKRDRDTSYLEEITITQLGEGFRNGTFTIEQVTSDYLYRIEKIDKNGPMLNSVISVNPDALEIAKELDRELAEGKSRGPLHGVPVILKDNIDTKDSMPTTAGATVLKNSFVGRDSKVAERLRAAGAVIIGKSNLSEWANFRANLSSSGWSGVGGQTKNPYVTDRNPCGSSSGSGVAVSANLCAFAIGTETNGSITCPSNNNGIVGIKPTVGLISRSGIIPISFTQDTPGPMTRTVEDAAIVMGALAGADSTDAMTLNKDAKFESNYQQYLQKDGLKGKRIGLLTNVSGFHFKVDSLTATTVAYLKGAGAEVIELTMRVPGEASGASFQVMLYEFKDGLEKYFASLGEGAPVRTLDELIEFNKKDSVELRYFDQQLLEMAAKKGTLEDSEYKKALALMLKKTREEGIDKLMNDNKLDAIIAPTGGPAWKTDMVNGDNFLGSSSSFAAISGYPNITVPMGFIGDLPVGVSFFGRAWSEPVLLNIAYSFEQGTMKRKAPKYLNSLMVKQK